MPGILFTGPTEGTKFWGGPVLKDPERLEDLVKPPLYWIWENLGGPVAPLAPPPVPAALIQQPSLFRGVIKISNPRVPNSYFTPKSRPKATFLVWFQAFSLKSKGAKTFSQNWWVPGTRGTHANITPAIKCVLISYHPKRVGKCHKHFFTALWAEM